MEMKTLERDFEKNDLREIFNSLSSLYLETKLEKEQQIHQVHELENEKTRLLEILKEMNSADERRFDSARKKIQLFHDESGMSMRWVSKQYHILPPVPEGGRSCYDQNYLSMVQSWGFDV